MNYDENQEIKQPDPFGEIEAMKKKKTVVVYDLMNDHDLKAIKLQTLTKVIQLPLDLNTYIFEITRLGSESILKVNPGRESFNLSEKDIEFQSITCQTIISIFL